MTSDPSVALSTRMAAVTSSSPTRHLLTLIIITTTTAIILLAVALPQVAGTGVAPADLSAYVMSTISSVSFVALSNETPHLNAIIYLNRKHTAMVIQLLRKIKALLISL